MNLFPIIQNAFSGTNIFYVVLGIIIGLGFGLSSKKAKKIGIGILTCFIIYALCEVLTNVASTLLGLVVAIAGTVSFGGFIGYIVSYIIVIIKK